MGISHLIYAHNNIPFELKEILDFLVISFPLTLSVAVIAVLIAKGKFNLFSLVVAVAGAALLSNLLHRIIGEFVRVDIGKTITDTFGYEQRYSGNSTVMMWALRVFGIY